MHVFTLSFWALHFATCSAVRFLHKRAVNLFNKLMENAMGALGITALLDLISQMALTLVAATSIFLAGVGLVYLRKKSCGT
jgi:hypothetical protein